jgi:hypothetical protein
MADKTKATVATPTADYKEMEAKRWLCRVLMIGTGRFESGDGSFLDNAEILLPQYGSEHPDDYDFRRDHLTILPPDFPDSVDAVVSSILNGPIVMEDAPEELWDAESRSGQWLNIDRQGRTGDAFVASVGTESIAEGLPWIFVDYWDPQEDATTEAERSQDARPYWTTIHARDIIEALHIDGTLTRCRWRETVSPPTTESEWDCETLHRIRVVYRGDSRLGREDPLRYARFETWQKKADKDEWFPVEEPMWVGDKVTGTLSPPGSLSDDLAREFIDIPLYGMYSGYRRPGVAWPILRHQAEMVRMWALMHSDFASAQHYAMNPRDVIVGTTEEQFAQHNPGNTPAGQGNKVFLPKGGDWKILTHDGSSFDSTQQFLDVLAQRIRAAGIETLREPATGRELATLGLLDRERRMTRLEVISMFWESAVQNAVRRHELLLGREPTAQVALPDPNTALLVAPQLKASILRDAAGAEMADPETYWTIAKEILADDSIEPADIARRLAEFKASMSPL